MKKDKRGRYIDRYGIDWTKVEKRRAKFRKRFGDFRVKAPKRHEEYNG